MPIVLDVHGGVPAYRQIVEQVRFLIASGQLAAGSALPSTRALGHELGINPMTVSKAYAILEAEGVLEHHPGLPLTVRSQSPAALTAAREAELRARLEPVALAARQLGYSADAAARLFHDLLTDVLPPESAP